MGPGDLHEAIANLPSISDPNVIRGMSSLDDAGVYRLGQDLAIVQTIDFFTPIVDDPYTFGLIAAANALSDIYAMGARPVTAMNIVCFPSKSMDMSVLREILRGGADKLVEAEVPLVGGHSIDDADIKYGLSVTGVVHPDRLVTNSGARGGDKLVLTKPLGIGIISAALKEGKADHGAVARAVDSMATLNRRASEIMQEIGVHGCTDVTGFGLIGHAQQMAENSRVTLNIVAASVPFFPEAEGFAKAGFRSGGLGRNREYYSLKSQMARDVPEYLQNILFDPQTSGGLLIAVTSEKAAQMLSRLHEQGVPQASVIGEVSPEPSGLVFVD